MCVLNPKTRTIIKIEKQERTQVNSTGMSGKKMETKGTHAVAEGGLQVRVRVVVVVCGCLCVLASMCELVFSKPTEETTAITARQTGFWKAKKPKRQSKPTKIAERHLCHVSR